MTGKYKKGDACVRCQTTQSEDCAACESCFAAPDWKRPIRPPVESPIDAAKRAARKTARIEQERKDAAARAKSAALREKHEADREIALRSKGKDWDADHKPAQFATKGDIDRLTMLVEGLAQTKGAAANAAGE